MASRTVPGGRARSARPPDPRMFPILDAADHRLPSVTPTGVFAPLRDRRAETFSRCTLPKHRQECLCHTSRARSITVQAPQFAWHITRVVLAQMLLSGRANVAQTLLSVLVLGGIEIETRAIIPSCR